MRRTLLKVGKIASSFVWGTTDLGVGVVGTCSARLPLCTHESERKESKDPFTSETDVTDVSCKFSI